MFQTGYYTLSEGDFQTFVDWVWPDMKWGFAGQSQTAQLSITFLWRNIQGIRRLNMDLIRSRKQSNTSTRGSVAA